MTETDAQISSRPLTGNRRKLILVFGKAPQHSIDKTGCMGQACFFAERHTFIHGGAIRDLVHKKDLVSADLEDVSKLWLQLSAVIRSNIEIKQAFVLQNTKTELRGKRGLSCA